MSASITFHASLYNWCCFTVSHMIFTFQLKNGARNYCKSCIHSLVYCKRRRAMQRLTKGAHGLLLTKICAFFGTRHSVFDKVSIQIIALVWLSLCYFTRACGVLRPCTILALASSPRPSAILNVFGLIMIGITSRRCFNHAQNNHVSTTIRAMHSLIWTLFVAKHVSFVIRLIMFPPSVDAALLPSPSLAFLKTVVYSKARSFEIQPAFND